MTPLSMDRLNSQMSPDRLRIALANNLNVKCLAILGLLQTDYVKLFLNDP